MNRFALLSIVALFLLGYGPCSPDDPRADALGAPTAHECDALTAVTPDGATYCAHPRGSVAQGYTTETEIADAVDAGFGRFYAMCPEFAGLRAAVVLEDDYVFWVPQSPGAWAAGWTPGGLGSPTVVVALWSRGTTDDSPPPAYVQRPPGTNGYAWWRYTTRPLVPGLPHELLHVAIGDPLHRDPRWALVN